MSLQISGRHFKETPALKAYTQEKATKFYRHHKDIQKIVIEMDSEIAHRGKEADYIVDISVTTPGHVISVRDSERDMYKAIDKAVNRMVRALTKDKEKQQKKRYKSSSSI